MKSVVALRLNEVHRDLGETGVSTAWSDMRLDVVLHRPAPRHGLRRRPLPVHEYNLGVSAPRRAQGLRAWLPLGCMLAL